MVIFVFGNSDCPGDNTTLNFVPRLQNDFPQTTFQIVNSNDDLPLEDNPQHLTIIDVAIGLDRLTVLTQDDLGRLSLKRSISPHDYDLSLQLKLLKKLKILKRLTLIALPAYRRVRYSSLHSIVKKLVAQDMQGS